MLPHLTFECGIACTGNFMTHPMSTVQLKCSAVSRAGLPYCMTRTASSER